MPGKISVDGPKSTISAAPTSVPKGRSLAGPDSDDPIVSHQHVAVINHSVLVVYGHDRASEHRAPGRVKR
jgi:hypothetical protein